MPGTAVAQVIGAISRCRSKARIKYGRREDRNPHLPRAINIYGRREHSLVVGQFSPSFPSYYGIFNTCPTVISVEVRPFAAISASTLAPKLRAIYVSVSPGLTT